MAATAQANDRVKSLLPIASLGIMLAVLFWGYWNTLMFAARYWDNPKYSHGYLVPLFTLALLWLRRDPRAVVDSTIAYVGAGMMAVAALIMWGSTFVEVADTASLLDLIGVQIGVFGALLLVQQPMSTKVTPNAIWAGLGLLACGVGIRLVATRYVSNTPEMYSFIPAIMGVFLIMGGWDALRWAGAPLAFLVFMFPLPGVLDRELLAPLQRMATYSSTYCLNTMGIIAVDEMNKITLGDSETVMEVVEACSGLRMLTIFIALAVAITMITQRPLWEKIVIVASAIPIALAVNIIRITVTGIMYLTVGGELADKMFHAMAGWFMMPMALGLLYVEFQVLSHLFIEDGPSGPLPVA